ncbi:MAG: hypothetical protein Kow00109_25390 [Acidobacteriota bacterium]
MSRRAKSRIGFGCQLGLLSLALLVGGSILRAASSQAAEAAAVDVFLWFDTEDYLLPESDGALLRLATWLRARGLRATFKLVGEKARVLERRDRRDVLEALRFHAVGYHTDFHSVHPTPAELLAHLGWYEGVAEFDRRERGGFEDVARITGRVPVCYGQPGSSWAPQVYGALLRWGVPVYLDAAEHVDLQGQPFWYAGILGLQSLRHTLRAELGGPEDLRLARERFTAAYRDLQRNGGGVVSIYYHPCEFVHAQFWDAVNFAQGANPPRRLWRLPPTKDRQAIATAFATFESFVEFVAGHPGVRFRGADEAVALFRDEARGRAFSTTELREFAARCAAGQIGYQVVGGVSVSAAEQLFLLASATADGNSETGHRWRLPETPLLGPIRPQPAAGEHTVDWEQVRVAAKDVHSFMLHHHRVPDEVWLGSRAVSPESFLAGLATGFLAGDSSEPVVFRPAELVAARHVRNDDGLWGWIIFPPGFSAPEMMALGARQAWTLKPALRQTD